MMMITLYFTIFRTKILLGNMFTKGRISILLYLLLMLVGIYYGVQFFIIVIAVYLLFMVCMSYLIIRKLNNYKTQKFTASKFARLLFEANILEYSLAPFSAFLLSILYKLGVLAFLLTSTILMLLLFLITKIKSLL